MYTQFTVRICSCKIYAKYSGYKWFYVE